MAATRLQRFSIVVHNMFTLKETIEKIPISDVNAGFYYTTF